MIARDMCSAFMAHSLTGQHSLTGELLTQIEEFCQRCVEDVGVLLLPANVYSHTASIQQRRFRLGIGRTDLQHGLNALSDYLLVKPVKMG